MTMENLKKILQKNGLKVWQVAKAMGVSRSGFYDLAHYDFQNHEKDVKKALAKLTA